MTHEEVDAWLEYRLDAITALWPASEVASLKSEARAIAKSLHRALDSRPCAPTHVGNETMH